ncbi:hypothetical protein GOB04_16590 [Sinorhizobium meliloti]|nr:hypothetical protein [Sinorhizobium meliloti]
MTDREMINAARFLLDRLDDYEARMDDIDDEREFIGHVAPAAARLRSCLLDKPEAVEVVGSRDALIDRLVKALEAAETYVIDGMTTAKQNLEMNAAYPARKPRYEAELQEARDIYAECQAARRAALAAAKDKP